MGHEALVRFGVAMEGSLLRDFDAYAERRGSTRSEALRDLARAAVGRGNVAAGVPAMAALTLVYDHHVRDLTEKLTELQHDYGESIRSTLHVHIDHDHCLEVIVMHGRSDQLQALADRILGMRGVLHGGIEVIADARLAPPRSTAHDHTKQRQPRASKKRR